MACSRISVPLCGNGEIIGETGLYLPNVAAPYRKEQGFLSRTGAAASSPEIHVSSRRALIVFGGNAGPCKLRAGGKILLYGACGGQPSLLRLLRSDLSCKENVCSLLLNGNSSFADGAEAYLRMFLREPAVYQTILAAVAGGAARLQELEQRTGFSAGKLSKYLSTLVERGILARWIPATEMQIPKQHKRHCISWKIHFFCFIISTSFPIRAFWMPAGNGSCFVLCENNTGKVLPPCFSASLYAAIQGSNTGDGSR